MQTIPISPQSLIDMVHVNHIWDGTYSTSELITHHKDDVYDWYLVYESGWGNSARVHLVSASDGDWALAKVYDYLEENEGLEEAWRLSSIDRIDLINL